MLRDNWPVIDWREPIGLQERLEGRSSHNGEFSVMSRSRSQGTEVTIVTGAFSVVRARALSLSSSTQARVPGRCHGDRPKPLMLWCELARVR